MGQQFALGGPDPQIQHRPALIYPCTEHAPDVLQTVAGDSGGHHRVRVLVPKPVEQAGRVQKIHLVEDDHCRVLRDSQIVQDLVGRHDLIFALRVAHVHDVEQEIRLDRFLQCASK